MSSSAQPITTARFESALQELPLSTLHQTAAEIRNSQAHLESSNRELKPDADAGDQVCMQAVLENVEVIERMKLRLDLLKAEVERRGMPWVEDEPAATADLQDAMRVNGSVNEPTQGTEGGSGSNQVSQSSTEPTRNGQLSDDELRRRLEERMSQMDEDEEDGVHL